MRKKITLALLALCVAVPGVYAEMKIGFINSELILVKYDGAKEAADKLNKEVAKWEQEATKKQKDLKDLKDKLDKQSLLLSSERKKELEDSLQAKYIQYQQFLQEKFGQKGDAYSKNEELSKPIVEKINKILEKIGKEEGFDYIFDARAGGIVFAKPTYDLTEKVLQLLNKEK